MAEIVNLRTARKRAARARKGEVAERNRTLHGVSSAERALAARVRERAERQVDGAERDRGQSADT